MSAIIHKNVARGNPQLSIILLDWGCRERFTTLDWLSEQNIPRDRYELIWVELYDRVIDEVMEKADIVITCNQKGKYHKHIGYNVGLLEARGDLICVCDSDAVFPVDFVSSVFRSFAMEDDGSAQPLVLMHYEWRTSLLYPDGLSDAEILKDSSRWHWWPLIVNEGACVTIRRADAIRFGGFDEHPSYLGYLCGPYDLAWRLVNAGWPEVWHDDSVALWHFAHPDPISGNGQKASLRQLMEKAYPHLQGHALTAVEAFSTGRFQPLQENAKIWAIRMADRHIGSNLEGGYANLTGQAGFSPWFIRKLWLHLYCEIWGQYFYDRGWKPARRSIRTVLGERLSSKLRVLYNEFVAFYLVDHHILAQHPVLLASYRGFNIVKVLNSFYAAPHGVSLDLSTEDGRVSPCLVKSNDYLSLLRILRYQSKN